MKTIFFLTGEHVQLAKEEVLALTNSKEYKLVDRILITDSTEDFSDRLAFTHSTYRFLFTCNLEDLEQTINEFDWLSVYKDEFCVRVTNLPETQHLVEKDVADLVWISLQKQMLTKLTDKDKKEVKPTVNLTNPKYVFEFFVTKEGIFMGLKLADIDKSFFDRWPHKRPAFHPTSITSKLARCCVNLSGIKEGILYDPFCGVGAILIEAGMMKIKCMGSDLSENKLEMAKINLDHYNINSTLTKQDALKLPAGKYNCIVTDPPYGKNEKVSQDLGSFYKSFILSAYNSLKKDGVLVMIAPNKIDLFNPGFKIKTTVEWFVHGSLTRKILVLVKE